MMEVEVDARRTAVKFGLSQLTSAQIRRVLSYRDEMAHDGGNFVNGHYCPLAVACGLPGVVKDPTNEKVVAILELMGYKVNNLAGVAGEFYRVDRAADLKSVALEILSEREPK